VHELVAIATIGDGILREADEHRILKVALAGGLAPGVACAQIEDALRALGAKRAESAPPSATPPPAPDQAPGPGSAAPGTDVPPPPGATEDAVQKAISRKLGKRPGSASHEAVPAAPAPPVAHAARAPDPPSSGEIVVAELFLASPDSLPLPPAPTSELTLGVCSACLAPVSLADVRAGRAEDDGATKHCRACLSKLRAGLLCIACYRAIDRTELLDGRAVLEGDRAIHQVCLTIATKPTERSLARAVIEDGETLPLAGRLAAGPRKCAGCHVILPRSHFAAKRAFDVDGVFYCAGCAARTGRG
jgi:hypothetical protein